LNPILKSSNAVASEEIQEALEEAQEASEKVEGVQEVDRLANEVQTRRRVLLGELRGKWTS
jgi:hypothetical protein